MRVDTPTSAPAENVGRGIGGLFRRLPGLGGDSGNDNSKATAAEPKKLKNGEPAVIHTRLPLQDAPARVRAFLDGKNFRTEIAGDTVKTDWSSESKCPGMTVAKCRERVDVRVEPIATGGAILRIWVSESRANRTSNRWSNGQPKGEITAKLAAELEAHLGALAPATQQ
jgi:hypothetical protein